MNLDFPTRFLKKLDIYQQIRNGQGISKHKKLWKYEAAFLQIAYGNSHQFLNECPNDDMVKDWIKRIENDYDGDALPQVIGNLIWRGYLIKKDSSTYNITKEGLFVGEVVADINNKSCIIKFWNKYRYSLILDLLWLVIAIALIKLFFPEKFLNDIQTFLHLNSIKNYFIAIFIAWPLFNWIYRSFYSALEK
ncbi:MAG: hypothetical protein WA055_03270 [Candidatus Moraniibacteriota bacterium]